MLSRMKSLVILIIIFSAPAAGQNSWKVGKSDCTRGDEPAGVLVAGRFFDKSRGWVVGETGELRSR